MVRCPIISFSWCILAVHKEKEDQFVTIEYLPTIFPQAPAVPNGSGTVGIHQCHHGVYPHGTEHELDRKVQVLPSRHHGQPCRPDGLQQLRLRGAR